MTSSTPRQPIVVGVDASDSARDAAVWAADLAAVRQCALHLVWVVPGYPQDAAPVEVPRWLHELADSAVRSGADATDTEIVSGATERLLLQRAVGARLLVVGSYGEAAWSGMLAGRTGLALVEQAPCPVAVVRGSSPRIPPPRRGPIVVGVDGSPASVRALVLGADLAAATGAELLAVHAFTDVTESGGAPHRRHEEWARLEAEAEAELEAAEVAALRDSPKVRFRRQIIGGTTLGVLMGYAGSARMIVVGQRDERAPAGEMVLGSTSRGLVEFAPCPVVVLPAVARAPGLVVGADTGVRPARD
jgi:nucleotide-binding universal stress UspA family protein